ncbi:NACHT, LRR and PYD domains-containing protein 12 [Beauveria bassiana D1-5]|uniref:NACHT, LRR and PYD domains-containing protein 12 n=1 Tax=Beauveria bassiana D1-5 TaxID=1245745 RepID=A0A0A2VUG1_BEABA|nr:NACHT, LRR and PYD domains-containing protein 12 [Beauveria bassiana D1-5]
MPSRWLPHTRSSNPAPSTANNDPDASLPTREGVYLQEVDLKRTEADTDIIAIHGLDTRSPNTWTWKDPRDPNNKSKWNNWLGPDMLSAKVNRARIFTCDWPADLFVSSDMIQMTIEENAVPLLEGIESALFTSNTRPQDRPIFFIASCLGGLILIKSLVHADDKRNNYYRIRQATRGAVFLATPFRGTSFQDVAAWAEMALKAKASTKGRNVSRIIESVKGSTFGPEQSVSNFTRLCRDNDYPCEVFSFFELKKTSLPHKAFPWLPRWLDQKKQLVTRSSATLDIIIDPLPLKRPHSLMNKFKDSKCGDYIEVANKIHGMIQTIRAGTPLEQADRLIRDEHYTADRLKIERLSGKLLPIEHCYINLAITKQSDQEAHLSKGNGDLTRPPFSLLTRQQVDASEKSMQVDLAAVFDERRGENDVLINPRRIMIRGRAGVGKSTLCKKMVYDFTHGTETELHRSWKKLFDRVLWIPLRRLKIQPVEGWSLESLFYHEYFKKGGEDEGHRLAKVLSQALRSPNTSRTLFILDGLDEISGSWDSKDYRTEFLLELLKQPAVIITTRPSARLPADVKTTDIDLETIGFYPDQVKDYVETTFTEREKADEVQLFIEGRWLMQGLVRIPIQLDALCYTWDDLNTDDIPNTMTGLYKEIELKLWKKDVVRLEKRHDDKVLTGNDLQTIFSSGHLNDISNRFAPHLLLDKSLPSLSFLRASDPSMDCHNRSYHFIHLTFQEYFAARYFTQQWKDPKGRLQFVTLGSNNAGLSSRPREFLQKQKYTERYDIFWRFVAGLLDGSGQSSEFISALEDEPLDLLGPTHQRLIMHCLGEISGELPSRKSIEQRLAQWLLFDCKLNGTATLVHEVEFPEEALKTVILDKSHNFQKKILYSLAYRASFSHSIAEAVAAQLSGADPGVREAAIRVFNTCAALPEGVLELIAAHVGDQNRYLRRAAVFSLSKRAALPVEVLKALVTRLGDEDLDVQDVANQILRTHAALPDDVVKAMAAWLDDKDLYVRISAIISFSVHATLPDEVLEAVAALLDDKDPDVQRAVSQDLGNRTALPAEVLEVVAARLSDKKQYMRWIATTALKRAALPDHVFKVMVARLSDEDRDVRVGAVEALGTRATLSNEVLMALALRLSDEDFHVRLAAIKALGESVALPDEVLKALALRLSDQSSDVRAAATKALGKRVVLPDEMFKTLVS